VELYVVFKFVKDHIWGVLDVIIREPFVLTRSLLNTGPDCRPKVEKEAAAQWEVQLACSQLQNQSGVPIFDIDLLYHY